MQEGERAFGSYFLYSKCKTSEIYNDNKHLTRLVEITTKNTTKKALTK